MSERKVLNKYYPPDFDPSKIPKCKEPRNKTFGIRLMAPCNMRCSTCGEYIYKVQCSLRSRVKLLIQIRHEINKEQLFSGLLDLIILGPINFMPSITKLLSSACARRNINTNVFAGEEVQRA